MATKKPKKSTRKKTVKRGKTTRTKRRAAKGPPSRVGTNGLPASDVLSIEVTIPPSADGLSVVKASERPGRTNIHRFYANKAVADRAAAELSNLGFVVTARSRTSISVKGTVELFTATFGTQLDLFRQPVRRVDDTTYQEFYYAVDAASWAVPARLEGLVDDAYIQWPHIYMESPIPPRVDYHHLRVPGDVVLALNVDEVHRQGFTGRGVRLAMVDTGFFTRHQYFEERGYNMSVVLAPGATDAGKDGHGHGTAECANVLAVAPDVIFIGVKLRNEANPNAGASLAEGFKTAVAQNPDIITVSIGFDLVFSGTRQHLPLLPNSLRPLEADVEDAVASGIVVVFSAGNGHVSFPGMMPDVISAGGTFVDEDMDREASDYASAFDSRIYTGRHVPDFAGLVGLVNTAGAYIMLPVQAGCEMEQETAQDSHFPDGTATNDGWVVISGTSAAAPQIAGVCALLKEKGPTLTPRDIKSVLQRTARDVTRGRAHGASNQGVALPAGPGADGATGHGLVDAFAAWSQV